MVVKIVAEWVRAYELEKAKALEIMALRSGDNILAIVKKMNMYEKSWRIMELCGKLISDDDSIGEIYFETYEEVIAAVESYFARERLGKEFEPKIYVEKEEYIEDAIEIMTDEWIRDDQYCTETLYTLRNWVVWKLKGGLGVTAENLGKKLKELQERLKNEMFSTGEDLKVITDEIDVLNRDIRRAYEYKR